MLIRKCYRCYFVFGGVQMSKKQKDPSKAGVSAASVEGNAGPGAEKAHKDKKNSQNDQFKR